MSAFSARVLVHLKGASMQFVHGMKLKHTLTTSGFISAASPQVAHVIGVVLLTELMAAQQRTAAGNRPPESCCQGPPPDQWFFKVPEQVLWSVEPQTEQRKALGEWRPPPFISGSDKHTDHQNRQTLKSLATISFNLRQRSCFPILPSVVPMCG